ncbi:MAG: hypothetical protein ACF8XB_20690 [Planctomycetota bacterium JB042]
MTIRDLVPPVLALLLVACAKGPAPVGYDGAVPSGEGQMILGGLRGETLTDENGARWTIGPFGVVPNPVTGKGPVVLLRRGEEVRYLPVATDEEARALAESVRGDG